MIQFFAPDIATTLTLPESDSAHCVRVLRMKEGDELQVVDGKGNVYHCRLTLAHQKHAQVELLSSESIPPYWHAPITVAVAPTKNMDRMEWLVEKLVEMGVDRIVPLSCRYSERKEIKTERLLKIAVSAMKQSLKATIPVISEMTPIAEFIASDTSEQKFVAYCAPEIPRRKLVSLYRPGLSATILIGPEGDFSSKEISDTIAAGYQPVTLGDARLRTETAAMVACSMFHTINQLQNE
ncbi:MAG: 16S rRNA (uracil(1498)-N(3))-methyltransferase [Muribaculaceae bacterium]|nr:16S rRNA (uracil(1498)-N(3))-methyltransferase [Muribaculaceae bacterium]